MKYIDQTEVHAKKYNDQFSLLKRLDELEIIKNILAKDNPFIINLELRHDYDIPEIPEGNKTQSI